MTTSSREALTSGATAEWYTPSDIIRRVKATLGRYLFDPCSCEQAQKIVQAKWWITKESKPDGLNADWFGNVYLNPPTGLWRDFFGKLLKHYINFDICSAVYMGYAIGQLPAALKLAREALGDKAQYHLTVAILHKRIKFIDANGNEGKSPTHHNFVMCLSESHVTHRSFIDNFKDIATILEISA